MKIFTFSPENITLREKRSNNEQNLNILDKIFIKYSDEELKNERFTFQNSRSR